MEVKIGEEFTVEDIMEEVEKFQIGTMNTDEGTMTEEYHSETEGCY